MALALPQGNRSAGISFNIYKPFDGCDIEDAMPHITSLVASLRQSHEFKAAVLKSINGSWAAVFAVWDEGSGAESDSPAVSYALRSTEMLAKELASIVRLVESCWLQEISAEHKDVSFARLSVGDIVSVRRIYSDCHNQEVLAYSCLALIKAYFGQMQGLLSSTFYKSMDGLRIIGLGIWDTAESASVLLSKATPSPGEAYWRDLGAKKLKYEVCQVVYVTG